MNQAISLEVRFFIVSVLSGVVLLVAYDILRILRIILKQGVIQIGIQDFLFWVVSGGVIFRMMYRMNDGVVRGFSIIGIFLGMVIYKYSISDWIVHKMSSVILIIWHWIKKIFFLLVSPITWLGKQVIRAVKFFARKIGKLENRVIFTVKRVFIGLYEGLQNKYKSYKIKLEAKKERRRQARAEKERAKKGSAGAEVSNRGNNGIAAGSGQQTISMIKKEPQAVAVHQARVTSRMVPR